MKRMQKQAIRLTKQHFGRGVLVTLGMLLLRLPVWAVIVSLYTQNTYLISFLKRCGVRKPDSLLIAGIELALMFLWLVIIILPARFGYGRWTKALVSGERARSPFLLHCHWLAAMKGRLISFLCTLPMCGALVAVWYYKSVHQDSKALLTGLKQLGGFFLGAEAATGEKYKGGLIAVFIFLAVLAVLTVVLWNLFWGAECVPARVKRTKAQRCLFRKQKVRSALAGIACVLPTLIAFLVYAARAILSQQSMTARVAAVLSLIDATPPDWLLYVAAANVILLVLPVHFGRCMARAVCMNELEEKKTDEA